LTLCEQYPRIEVNYLICASFPKLCTRSSGSSSSKILGQHVSAAWFAICNPDSACARAPPQRHPQEKFQSFLDVYIVWSSLLLRISHRPACCVSYLNILVLMQMQLPNLISKVFHSERQSNSRYSFTETDLLRCASHSFLAAVIGNFPLC